MNAQAKRITDSAHRRSFIGGSDARTIMGDDPAALLRLWREKRGEVDPEDLSANLIVQLGPVPERLNRLSVPGSLSRICNIAVVRRSRHRGLLGSSEQNVRLWIAAGLNVPSGVESFASSTTP